MIWIAIFLVAAGSLMILKPNIVWAISEKWKSNNADEPSAAYKISIRLGGILCVLTGLASIYLYLSQ